MVKASWDFPLRSSTLHAGTARLCRMYFSIDFIYNMCCEYGHWEIQLEKNTPFIHAFLQFCVLQVTFLETLSAGHLFYQTLWRETWTERTVRSNLGCICLIVLVLLTLNFTSQESHIFKSLFLAWWHKIIHGDQFPSCNGTVLNSCSEPVLVSLCLTHSNLSFSKSLSLSPSFRRHCMCLTRLGLLFPASQPEHSKNLIYHLRPGGHTHSHTHTHTFTCSDDKTRADTLSHIDTTHVCTGGNGTHYVHAHTHAEVKVCWVLL